MAFSVIEHPDTLRTDTSRAPSQLCTEVVPEGDLDAFTLPALIRVVDEAVRTSTRVELDLSRVDFLSIAAAAYVWQRVGSPGARAVEITGASAAASRALVVTGFGAAPTFGGALHG